MLTLLVRQCRAAGWLVLYVPSGHSWISGWFYEKDEESGFYDTPSQAETSLKVSFFCACGLACVQTKCSCFRSQVFWIGGGFYQEVDQSGSRTRCPVFCDARLHQPEDGSTKKPETLGLYDRPVRAIASLTVR